MYRKRIVLLIVLLSIVCLLFFLSACGKSKDKWKIIEQKNPTCTENGYTVYENKSGETRIESIPAFGHKYVMIEETPETCTEAGLKKNRCNVCGDEVSETIPPSGHDYELALTVPATCTERKYEFWVCKKDSATMVQYGEALGHKWQLIQAIEPTYSTNGAYSFRCARCEEEKTEIIPELKYDLAINYHYGLTDTYFKTQINTQDNSGYSLGEASYFATSDHRDPILFRDDLAFQDYYTHTVWSAKPISTDDGKVYQVDSGFKVSFGFNLTTQSFTEERKQKYAEYLGLFESLDYLRIVHQKKSSNPYYTIFEVVDFSESYIEISKLVDGKFVTIGSVKTTDEWDSVLGMKEIMFSDNNGQLFFEAGIYRILYKSSVSWFIESSAGVIYDGNGTECFPYGVFNDQYDYFYVNVTEDTYNVLLPDDLNEEKPMFYQLYFSDARTSTPFVKSGDRVEVGEQFKLCVNSKIRESNGSYYCDKERLDEWELRISVYDPETDSYLETQMINLFSLIDGDKIWIIQPKNYTNEGDCKIEVSYTFYDVETGETVSASEVFYLYIV